MKLFKGCGEEYLRRHNEIWLELKELLKRSGIAEYSIFLDRETNILFAYLTIENSEELEKLPHAPVMKKWWEHMKDIMETNEDNSPVSSPLVEVFNLE